MNIADFKLPSGATIAEETYSIVEIAYPQNWEAAMEISEIIRQLVVDGYIVTRNGPIPAQLLSREANKFLVRLQKRVTPFMVVSSA